MLRKQKKKAAAKWYKIIVAMYYLHINCSNECTALDRASINSNYTPRRISIISFRLVLFCFS